MNAVGNFFTNLVESFVRGFIAMLPIAGILAIISVIPAWITHVVVCIQNETWVFLLAGAIFAPIGVVHGWGIWFGWWA